MSTTAEKTLAEASAPPAHTKEAEPSETLAPATEPTTQSEPTTTTEPTTEAPANEAQLISTTTPAETAPAETSSEPAWPALSEDHPLSTLFAQLPEILKEADYNEVYGIHLDPATPFHTKLILQKFLRANANDIAKATTQLTDTLKWRKEYQPLKAKDEVFEAKRFAGLGYVTTLEGVPTSANKTDVATFNIYGAVKDNKAAFGDLDGFLRWRVGLMELGIAKLALETATTPIPDFGQGPDPYQGYQIHDYLSVSFLRQDPVVKAATKKTIDTLSRYYPETLSRKFFVNVPVIMGWVFTAMKLVVSKETVKKFTVLSYGEQLAAELGPGIPEVYGGKAAGLDTIAETLKLE